MFIPKCTLRIKYVKNYIKPSLIVFPKETINIQRQSWTSNSFMRFLADMYRVKGFHLRNTFSLLRLLLLPRICFPCTLQASRDSRIVIASLKPLHRDSCPVAARTIPLLTLVKSLLCWTQSWKFPNSPRKHKPLQMVFPVIYDATRDTMEMSWAWYALCV